MREADFDIVPIVEMCKDEMVWISAYVIDGCNEILARGFISPTSAPIRRAVVIQICCVGVHVVCDDSEGHNC